MCWRSLKPFFSRHSQIPAQLCAGFTPPNVSAATVTMLIPELELQALRFFNRDELEGLQMHSRYLRNLVDSHAKTLPLRRIHELCVGLRIAIRYEQTLELSLS